VARLSLPAVVVEPSTAVSAVFPSSNILPENLLKFYIHFSAPMQQGNLYKHIYLLDHVGKKVELPFLEIDEELWDPSFTRLTLFIDPGRIKRGVKPLEEIGPALETGKAYTLVIENDLRDARGAPLKLTFRKQFTAGPPDRDPPDPSQWKITRPHTGTTEPLTIRFPESMDHALAMRVIKILGSTGKPLPGQTSLVDQERTWRFIPANTWQKGRFTISSPTTIEEPAERRMTRKAVTIPFDLP
jgi:hypothetical protein